MMKMMIMMLMMVMVIKIMKSDDDDDDNTKPARQLNVEVVVVNLVPFCRCQLHLIRPKSFYVQHFLCHDRCYDSMLMLITLISECG